MIFKLYKFRLAIWPYFCLIFLLSSSFMGASFVLEEKRVRLILHFMLLQILFLIMTLGDSSILQCASHTAHRNRVIRRKRARAF